MSVQISTNCITCGACLWECPTEAISPGDPRPIVDKNSCTECYGFFGESQCIVVCPANAIAAIPESQEKLLQKFHNICPNQQPQDTWIWQRIGPSVQ
jgi:ferredoxin